MTADPFRLPVALFEALARGGGGAEAMRTLVAARRSRTLQLIRLIARANPGTRAAFEVLAEVQRAAPGVVGDVVGDPSVGAWATRTALGPGRKESDHLSLVAAAAALRAGIPVRLSVPRTRCVWLPSVGVVPAPLDGEVVVAGGRVAGRPVRATPVITIAALSLRLEDWAACPVPAAMRVSRTVDLSLWRQRISAAWEILAGHHPQVADAMAAGISVVTPLLRSAGGNSSATAADAFGCVFTSLPADARSLAVIFAHELRHNSLVALMDLFPLLTPGCPETFYAPWRGDPRPLIGLLHGTYAHLGVAGFWRRQRWVETGHLAHDANVQFARWREAARNAAGAMLRCDWLTPTGRLFVSRMLEVLEQWCDESVPAAAANTATRLLAEHRAHWSG